MPLTIDAKRPLPILRHANPLYTRFMILRQVKVAFVLIAMLMTLSIGAKAVGALQPPNPALRGFIEGCEGKPQPCWYGIVPGVTTLDDAQKILTDLKFVETHYDTLKHTTSFIHHTRPACELKTIASENLKLVAKLSLYNCTGVLLLGEMAEFSGMAQYVFPLCKGDLFVARDSRYVFYYAWGEDRYRSIKRRWITPFATVNALMLSATPGSGYFDLPLDEQMMTFALNEWHDYDDLRAYRKRNGIVSGTVLCR